MKLIFLLGLLAVTGLSFSQTPDLKTTGYAGSYSFGDDIEKGPVGRAIIYPETDSTILFFVDVCRGAGSSAIGQRYGRVTIKNGNGIYFSKKESDTKGCKLKFTIDNNLLTIKTLNECSECGLGNSKYADNQYKRKFNIVPGYFTDIEGRRVYFDKTKPEDYLK